MLMSKEDRTLVIGSQRVKLDAISNKVRQDIAFLSARIDAMKAQRVPNEVVLRTYESMLASRESVMSWLMEYDESDDSAQRLNNLNLN
ncbi:hypothetical protein R50073_44670 [Maricurvus nonylphenolicus]